MSIEPPRPLAWQSAAEEDAVRLRIARAVRRGRLVLLWERLWPRLVWPLCVLGAFLALSGLGVWIGMADWLRIGLLVLFGVALVAACLPLALVRRATDAEALVRVELKTGRPHRPATAALDRLGAQQADPATQAIWAAHRARVLGSLTDLRAGWPAPGMVRRDPYAIRFLVVLLLFVAVLASGSHLGDRVSDAFHGMASPAAVAVDARIDAWAAPPAYTGRPPIYLTGETLRTGDAPIAVPTGTEVIVRIGGGAEEIAVGRSEDGTGFTPVPAEPATDAAIEEHRVTLASPTTVSVRSGNDDLYAWSFTVVADRPPVIAFAGTPAPTAAGALQVGYRATDDYGVAAVRGAMTLVAPQPANAIPLVGPPDMPLAAPAAGSADGQASGTIDLTMHPWAGQPVTLTLVATDAAGQDGRSPPMSFTLPARSFTNPVARALIEQRRVLALNANDAPQVASALDLMTLSPETFAEDPGDYLALRSAYYRLRFARDDDALRGVVDYLWQLAVAMEDGPVQDAAAQLQAATDALNDALARNASEAEIAALMDQMRAAMQTYTQALAQQAAGQQPAPNDPNGQTVNQDQLDAMMDEIEERADAGDTEGAQQLLNQMNQMLQNAQTGNIADMQNQTQDQQAAQQLQELTDIITQQQQLRDDTFTLQQQQDQPLDGANDLSTQQFLDRLRQQRADQQTEGQALQQQQNGLGDTLRDLIDLMEGGGDDTNQLGAALEGMGKAAGQLGEGQAGDAGTTQGDVLDNLQGGAQDLAQALIERAPGNLPGAPTAAGGGQQDPFGRPIPTTGGDPGDETQVPDQIDRQRARDILDSIRQRLEDENRPQAEIDYLQRLIDQY